MQNENPNNDFHWKNKLEDLESLPGEAFNKESAWDRLYSRMHKKNSKKKLSWLYGAAACLMVALLISWFWTNKKENVLVKNNAEQNQGLKSNSTQSILIKNDSPAIVSSTFVERKSPVKPVVNQNKIVTAVDSKKLIVEDMVHQKDNEKIIEPEITNAIEPSDAQNNLTAIVPGKKKLQVVHINELGELNTEPTMVVHQAELHTFQIKFANEEVFANTHTGAKKSGFNILQTKNSPN